MFKKILSLVVAVAMLATMIVGVASCAQSDEFKVGVILLGDETESYSKAHIDGIEAAIKELGLTEDQVIWKTMVPETGECTAAAEDLVDRGCSLIIANSYGYQNYIADVAEEYPEVDFISMTGDFAQVSGLDNLYNAYTNVYEARYITGVVAGMKIQELIEDGELTQEKVPNSFDEDGNVKVGYVGAYNYAEVVSGYTSFYLGVKSVVENVVMNVQYTNSWSDLDLEKTIAGSLIDSGCVVIGQHSDTTGAPGACQEAFDDGEIVYSVGYNVDMSAVAPDVTLTSAANNWSVYYTYAIKAAMDGEELQRNWAKGYEHDAVTITPLGENCADGTQEAVDAAIAKIKDGTLKVFDINNFTVGGEKVTEHEVNFSYMDFSTNPPTVVYEGPTENVIIDGEFSESTFRAAPYFAIRIDGITEITKG